MKKFRFSKFISRVLLSLAFIGSQSTIAFSQGGWNIKYIPSDSITSVLEGTEVRIDFKSSIKDSLMKAVDVFDIRGLLSTEDTVVINVEEEKLHFVEDWNIYLDRGFFSEQGLCSINISSFGNACIGSMKIVKVEDEELVLEVEFKELLQNSRKTIAIPKADIKGILMCFTR